MPDRPVHVILKVDSKPVVDALRKIQEALADPVFVANIRAASTAGKFRRGGVMSPHQGRDHPARSAMHAAYDRRRRARRRKR